ncbi:MAG TPA: hypothetical protein VGM44_12450 [Polyangiaceae bacterium]
MPTNKLWLEHTERAAWESVEALREKLQEAEKRIERLAPPTEGWQELLGALDALKEDRGLAASGYAALLRELNEQLIAAFASARAREDELARQRERLSVPAVAERAPRFESDEIPESVFADDDEYESSSGAQFLRSLWRRYRAHVRETSRVSPDSLLLAIESEVDQLSELDEPELAESATTLAVLAMRLEREAKKRA